MAPEHGDKDEAPKSPPAAAATTSPRDGRSSTPEAANVVASNRDGSYAPAAEAPLPYDDSAPPLPDEPVPDAEDDGWESKWDYNAGAWYFYNRKTGVSQWENPRVPEATTYTYGSYDRNHASSSSAIASTAGAPGTSSPPRRKWGGYNPAIHGSYDPNADYAREATKEEEEAEAAAAAAAAATLNAPYGAGRDYSATAQFNRFTGKFQQAGQGPELHNDENKSKRQMYAFFDVDAAANSHDGRSLKAERRAKTLSKKQLKEYNERRKEKKEEKRKAWLRSD